MLKKWKNLLNPLLDLLYPELCISCDEEYPLDGIPFCLNCYAELPFTTLHDERDNIVEKFFWGRVEIEKGTALFYFQKGEVVQEMLHRLKYKNEKSIGTYLGQYYGEILKESSFLKDIDLIISVPIHPKKLKKRGYNQSALITEGISTVNEIPWSDNAIIKATETSSQTDKSREERLSNLLQTFEMKDPEYLKGKHVLILDDILTTGATLEAMCNLLKKVTDKISVAVVAVGKY